MAAAGSAAAASEVAEAAPCRAGTVVASWAAVASAAAAEARDLADRVVGSAATVAAASELHREQTVATG
jgi:predicted short-subunit dehydrogenase-like oxidoreductase (DUF2520 family)